MEDEFLTAEQVAKILQVHPFTVLKFIKKGKLKAAKLGRVYRIRRKDVDTFMDSLVESSETKPKTANKKEKKKKEQEQVIVIDENDEKRDTFTYDDDHYVIELTEDN